jgi:hypothetical protein
VEGNSPTSLNVSDLRYRRLVYRVYGRSLTTEGSTTHISPDVDRGNLDFVHIEVDVDRVDLDIAGVALDPDRVGLLEAIQHRAVVRLSRLDEGAPRLADWTVKEAQDAFPDAARLSAFLARVS